MGRCIDAEELLGKNLRRLAYAKRWGYFCTDHKLERLM